MGAVLFDFGGTIDTDGIHWSEKFWELYTQFGVRVRKKEVEEAFVRADELLVRSSELPRLTFYKTLHRQLTLQFAILRLEEESDLLKQMVDSCYEDVRTTITKAKSILGAVQSRYRLALVSNFYGNLEIVCREFELHPYFDAMIDSAVVGVRKPDPAILKIALRRLGGVAAEASTMVGDSYDRDILPAKGIGCRTIWLRGKSWTTPSSTDAADYTVIRLAEIREILGVASPTAGAQ